MDDQFPMNVLAEFGFAVTEEDMLRQCRARRDREEGERALELLAEAQRIGRPKVMVREVPLAADGPDAVRVGNVRIVSTFVREKLLQAPVAHAYVATCGAEVERWSQTLDDILDRFYVDELKKLWLKAATDALHADVIRRFAPGTHLASLNPGSLPQWPIEGQRELFRILGDTEGAVGVSLTESCLMLPAKSVSGILFSDRTGHVNCALCPRENCPNRRVPRAGA